MARKKIIEPRRLPTQARSRETVKKILKAAIKVVEKIGYNNATTNHIAREAQLSVGSVYQYFPSKESIFLALWDEQIQADYEWVAQQFETFKELSLDEFFRRALAFHISSFFSNARLKMELLRIVPKFATSQKISDTRHLFAKLIESVLLLHRNEIQVPDLGLAAQVLVNATMGNIETYISTDPKKLRDPLFQQELLRLGLGYLRGKAPKPLPL